MGFDGKRVENVILVSPTASPLTGDYATIQEAIDAAVTGNVIEVAPGSYVETVEWDLSAKLLKIKGAGNSKTLVTFTGSRDYGAQLNVSQEISGIKFDCSAMTVAGLRIVNGASGQELEDLEFITGAGVIGVKDETDTFSFSPYHRAVNVIASGTCDRVFQLEGETPWLFDRVRTVQSFNGNTVIELLGYSEIHLWGCDSSKRTGGAMVRTAGSGTPWVIDRGGKYYEAAFDFSSHPADLEIYYSTLGVGFGAKPIDMTVAGSSLKYRGGEDYQPGILTGAPSTLDLGAFTASAAGIVPSVVGSSIGEAVRALTSTGTGGTGLQPWRLWSYMRDRVMALGFGYKSDAAQEAWQVSVIDPDPAKQDTMTGGAVSTTATTATFVTVTGGVFAADEIVEIHNTDTSRNDGFAQVVSHVGTALVVAAGAGRAYDFLRENYIAASAEGSASNPVTITKVKVNVVRVKTDGTRWEAFDDNTATMSFALVGTTAATQAVTGHTTTFDHANLPSTGQKQALVGTSGSPGSANKYVTDADPRHAALPTLLAVRVQHSDLEADDTEQTIDFSSQLPAKAIVIGSWFDLDTEFSGGSASASIVSIGPKVANFDGYVDAEDIFTGAPTGQRSTLVNASELLDKNGVDIADAARTMGVTIGTVSDTVANLDAGDLTAYVLYIPTPIGAAIS